MNTFPELGQTKIQEEIDAARALIPDEGILQKITEAGTVLREHIEAERPDFILTTGASALVSRVVLHKINQALGRRIPVLRLSRRANELIYKASYPEEKIPEDERLAGISEEVEGIKRCHPQLTPESRIMIVDESIGTGIKAFATLVRMHQLGLPNVSFAALSGRSQVDFNNPDFIKERIADLAARRDDDFGKACAALREGKINIDFGKSVFVAHSASSGDRFHHWLTELSQKVSVRKFTFYEEGKERYPDSPLLQARSEIEKALTAALRRIGTIRIPSRQEELAASKK